MALSLWFIQILAVLIMISDSRQIAEVTAIQASPVTLFDDYMGKPITRFARVRATHVRRAGLLTSTQSTRRKL